MGGFSHYNLPINGNRYNFNATALFKKSLEDYPFDDFLEIAEKNSEGGIWIIGGFVYNNIIKELYDRPFEKPIDIDFLVERHKTKVECPEGWILGRTTVGDLSFSKENEYRIDLNGLVNFHSITLRGLPAEIQHFYTGNPLDIQSISYDCRKGIVEGEAGINAIKNKRIEVHNIREAQWEADRIAKLVGWPFSVDDLIIQKAAELGFEYKLPW